MNDLATIKSNITAIKANIAAACAVSGRDPSAVSLVIVTKTIDTATLQACEPLFAAESFAIFGENRVQELLTKHDHLPSIDWHMIGNLQRNKVKYIIDKVSLIHSVDSLKLVEEIERQASKIGKVQDILIEVNVAEEASKHGIKPTELRALVDACNLLPHVRTTGLMTVAPYVDNPEDNRKHFRHMAELLEELKSEWPHINQLSMGMTGDYQVAIEEGASVVRIGSGIFGERV